MTSGCTLATACCRVRAGCRCWQNFCAERDEAAPKAPEPREGIAALIQRLEKLPFGHQISRVATD